MTIPLLRLILSPLLFPLSLIYAAVTGLRNVLFDWHVLKSVEFKIPVISIGNLTVGGTGKTPHAEYLLELLASDHHIALLSRGYKRKSKGFILATEHTGPRDLGDEPYQICNKFKKTLVAVDAKRVHGIRSLQDHDPNLKAIVLDDAFQHRYVKPGISIVLIDYYRPVFKDFLLPLGNLRELPRNICRADIVIVTKAPETLTTQMQMHWQKKLCLLPGQTLFYTGFEYTGLVPVFDRNREQINLSELPGKTSHAIIISGIANPVPFIRKIQSLVESSEVIAYPDHHEYTPANMEEIKRRMMLHKDKNPVVITTEKDAVRLSQLIPSCSELRQNCYYLPVKIKFLNDSKHQFDKQILDFVKSRKK